MLITKENLQKRIKERLKGAPLIVVSNREPYVHSHGKKGISCKRIPGGLANALDPVLQACGGVWIAHGAGDADRASVDKSNEVGVPPENSSYTLHRLWMSKEEEQGFYYGYCNDALWPLCHIVYTRPNFRAPDWEQYKRLNKRFAEETVKVVTERKLEKAVVFIQDYHLALAPKYIKEERPDIITAHFWHIPWPNPEVFRICPNKTEILEGLLANDIMGFHTQYHCNNFMDTVANELEARIDRENSAITYGGTTALIRPFPISIDYEYTSKLADSPKAKESIKNLPEEINFPYKYLAVGIDRIDYTKGILERLNAIDRFLEKYPKYIGKFVYLGYGSLSRIHLETYKSINDRITSRIEEINWKYHADNNWQPIIFKRVNLDYAQMLGYYRAADLCLVSSLHDGMNLVAKEYVASQVDEKGMLILSMFTGAAREFTDAVLVNPYDPENFADAIRESIEMSPRERKKRMRGMRQIVKEHNVYKWVEDIITALTKL
jgi:trehalose 6-phosphate synthase